MTLVGKPYLVSYVSLYHHLAGIDADPQVLDWQFDRDEGALRRQNRIRVVYLEYREGDVLGQRVGEVLEYPQVADHVQEPFYNVVRDAEDRPDYVFDAAEEVVD